MNINKELLLKLENFYFLKQEQVDLIAREVSPFINFDYLNNQEVKDRMSVSYELRRMLIENDRDLDPLLNDILPKDESELK